MRGLKDLAILLAGIAHNLTTLARIFGAVDAQQLTEHNFDQITRQRIQEERKVRRLLIRKGGTLPQEIVKELSIWERMFHEEVHGSKFSFGGDALRLLQTGLEPSIGPPDPRLATTSWSNYMNRAVEISWLVVRLLPYLQPTEAAFGEDWRRKHEILDDSFRFSEQSLSKVRKEIGEAFMTFVNQKFSFERPFYYFEADGSGSRNLR